MNMNIAHQKQSLNAAQNNSTIKYVATITFWGIINSNEVNIHESMNMMCLLLTNIKLPKEGIFNHLKVIFTRINVSYLDNLFVPRTGC